MMQMTPYKKKIKGDIYRWVIQLPSGVEPPDTLYVVSTKPLIISETRELPAKAKRCPEDAVEFLKKKVQEKTFRKAVGATVIEAIERLLEVCE